MPDNPRLQFLLDLATMADRINLKVSPSVRTFTRTTVKFLVHICRFYSALALKGNNYVMIGWFSTDLLEIAFGKLSKDYGETYYITA